MGIAHNDISLSNLLCTERNGHIVGILNDFDLAGFMEPGARNPERMGWERTGSIAFMAMDLLMNPDGTEKRWYRHDLESFLWCLLWVMLKKPPVSWLDDGFAVVQSQKRALCDEIPELIRNINIDWKIVQDLVVDWIFDLRESSTARNRHLYSLLSGRKSHQVKDKSEGEGKTDTGHICQVVESVKAIDCAKDISAVKDISWVNVELLELCTT